MSDDVELLAVADDLYALTQAEFTPARDARAKELKSQDAALSAQVKSLRKPSVAAWVVNLLVRHETEQVEQVLAVGAALREAQQSLAGEELRALTKQRRQLTAAVTTRARSVAREHGTRVSDSVAEQVEATLTAAMVSEECARAVRSGLLVASLATTGMDDVDVAAAVAVPEALGFTATARDAEPEPASRPELHVVPDPEADRKALAAAEEKLAAAEAELGEADEALTEAAREVETLEARAMQVQAQIDELRTKIAELEETYEQVDDELGDAEDVRAEAEEARAEVARARDAAAAAVEKLQR